MANVIKRTVYQVEGLPQTFEREDEAAIMSILMMLGFGDASLAMDEGWEKISSNLRTNADSIRKQLNILLEPRNAK